MRRLTSLMFLLLLCPACGTSGDDTTKGEALTGRVSNPAGQALAAVEVAVLGTQTTVTTDAQGKFTLAEASGPIALRFSHTGYGSAFRQAEVPQVLDVVLSEAPAAQTVSLPAAGGQVVVTQGNASLTLPGETMVKPDRSPATGEVQVTIVPYNPLQYKLLPTSMVTDDGKTLASLGMAEIFVEQGGLRLQPAQGKTLPLTFTVDAGLQLGTPTDGYLLYYLNEQTGLWEQSGTGTYDAVARTWTTQLPHLSFPNGDMPMSCNFTVVGRVFEARGALVPGAVVNAGGNWGWGTQTSTGGDGGYSVSAAIWCGFPQDSTISVNHAIDGQQPPAPVTRQFPVGQASTVDFHYCLAAGATCLLADTCCGGVCKDGFCP